MNDPVLQAVIVCKRAAYSSGFWNLEGVGNEFWPEDFQGGDLNLDVFVRVGSLLDLEEHELTVQVWNLAVVDHEGVEALYSETLQLRQPDPAAGSERRFEIRARPLHLGTLHEIVIYFDGQSVGSVEFWIHGVE
jgi:hypothetical protein